MAANFDDERAFSREGRSIPQLIRDFAYEITALVRDEVDLAKREVSDNISQLGKGLSWFGLGALVFFAGLLVLLDAAVAGLLLVLPPGQPWLAPLIVGGVVLIIGALMLVGGRGKVRTHTLKPQRTLEEARRDHRLIKEKMS